MARDPTLSDEMRTALDEATAAMDHHAVSYALIGGLAASYRSQPRFTKDIDFLLQDPQLVLPRLLEDLHRRGFEFETLATIGEWTEHHMVTLSYHGIRIDWLHGARACQFSASFRLHGRSQGRERPPARPDHPVSIPNFLLRCAPKLPLDCA